MSESYNQRTWRRGVVHRQDENVLKRIAETGLTSPGGLINRMFYNNAPKWLGMIGWQVLNIISISNRRA